MITDRRPLMFFESSSARRGQRRPRGQCKYCKKETHGKDECVDHLHKRPYVANLLAELAQHQKDETAIIKKGSKAVNINGMHVSEILNELRLHGSMTEERLCRLTNFPAAVVSACLQKLLQENMLKVGKTKRGSTVAKVSE